MVKKENVSGNNANSGKKDEKQESKDPSTNEIPMVEIEKSSQLKTSANDSNQLNDQNSKSQTGGQKRPKNVEVPQTTEDLEAEIANEARKERARNSADDALAELKELGFDLNAPRYELCLRPQFKSGTLGKRVKVLSNFFRLNIPGGKVYKYEVTFEDSQVEKEVELGRKFKRLTKQINQKLLATFVQTTGCNVFWDRLYAYDNDRILIANQPLHGIPKEGKSFTFPFVEEPKKLFIQITLTPTVSLNLKFDQKISLDYHYLSQNQAVLQVIDIISKSQAFKDEIIYGSKIFYSDATRGRIPLNVGRDGLIKTPFEIASGYSQSTRLCEGGVMQNIDRATTVLFKGGPLIKAMCEQLGVSESQLNVTPENLGLLKDLTQIRVMTTYRGYPGKQLIKAFSPKPCNELIIESDDGRKSVSDYFRDHYKINLKYPNLPCIVYGQNTNCYVPVELCDILPNQRFQRRLRDELIRVVSQITTSQKPSQRSDQSAQTAVELFDQMRQNAFNIQLDPKQVAVDSRVLKPPALQYKNDPRFTPVQGDWTMQKQDKSMRKLLVAQKLSNWALISLESRKIDERFASMFVERLQQTGRSLGIEINNPALPYRLVKLADLENVLQFCKSKSIQLVMVIIYENTDLYNRLKYLGDQCAGIPTQVVLDKHFNPRGTPQGRQKLFDTKYLSGLLLKVNTKLGGTNLKLNECSKSAMLKERTMVVGVDVNHPGSGETGSVSIAAVVGSIDKDFMRYWTEIKVNPEREELVSIDQMIKPIMEKFKTTRGFYPDHIIVYRDGVSEGQYAQVMGFEIYPLHKELETYPNRPKLTYLIVQKRHSVRFYPSPGNETTKSGNIVPGSVIDTDVVHYKWFEFYLCSQNAFLGTARPAKYTVLWNSNQNSADEIQSATYYLCHLFARATKSIADPAPARYAHHAAARGKIHLCERMKAKKWTPEQMNAEIGKTLNVNDNLKQILYFI